MRMRNLYTRMTLELASALGAVLVGTVGCAVGPPSAPSTYAARSLVNMGPGSAPAVSGTYDFDLLGEAQGTACAEWGQRNAGGFFTVMVNGRPANYAVALAGATLASDDVRVNQAEAAAVFDALSKLKGSDVFFATRSVVQSETPERICATVWGQVARLKKGPTIAPGGDASPHAQAMLGPSPASTAAPAQYSQAPTVVTPVPAPAP
jgi:hypothetical protein